MNMMVKRWAMVTAAAIMVIGCGGEKTETPPTQDWNFAMEKVWESRAAHRR